MSQKKTRSPRLSLRQMGSSLSRGKWLFGFTVVSGNPMRERGMLSFRPRSRVGFPSSIVFFCGSLSCENEKLPTAPRLYLWWDRVYQLPRPRKN